MKRQEMPGPPETMTEVPQRRTVCVKTVTEKCVNIGSQKKQWLQVKSKKGCKSDEDVARFLIKSLYRLEKQKGLLHPGSSARRGKKRRVFKQGSYRVLTLQDDVWSQWHDLKQALKIDCNSKLATILVNAWYDRANFLKKFHNSQQCVPEYTSTTQSGSERGYIDADTGVTHTGKDPGEIVVKCEIEDLETDKEMHETITHSKDDKKFIKLNEEVSKNYQEGSKHHRTSSRVQSRGFRPNYASMEWKDDSCRDDNSIQENFEYVFNIKQEINENPVEQTNEETRGEMKKKKGEENDPDFIVSDDDMKYSTVSGEETSDMDLSGIYDNESAVDVKDGNLKDIEKETSTRKPNRERKNKSDYSQGIKCKRKRVSIKIDEFADGLEKKCKAERKVKKALDGESVKKPWVHIKLEDHQEKYRMEIFGSFERRNRNSNLIEELYTCMICGRFKSTAKNVFEEHIEKHVNMALECDQCDYVGRSELELNRHKVSAGHMDSVCKGQEYVCDVCGIVLYSRIARLTHIGKVHDDPQFKCKLCDGKFVTQPKKRHHVRTAHADIAQYCYRCNSDFRKLTLEEFKQHQENCKRGHQCQVCGVVLSSKDGLRRHMEGTHMGVRKYQCQICPYAAKSAKRLKEHVMAHRSVHPHSCDKCTFTCVQSYQLKSHMRTHSGEKPFKCTQCKFAAAWNVQLKNHLSIHELENSVTCRQCDIVFKNDKALKMHEKKDHYVFKLLDAEKTSS